MKFYKKILIIVFLIIVYIYICNISMMPNDIVLMQGDLLNLDTLFRNKCKRNANHGGFQ